MRILSVIHYPVFGGPHNRNLRLSSILARRGFNTIVLLPDEPGNAVERLEKAGASVLVRPLHRLRATVNPIPWTLFVAGFLPEVWMIRKLIRQKEISVVLINGLVNPHAAMAARMERVPVVWQILDTRAPMVMRRILMPLVTRFADVVMCTGMEVARAHPGALQMGDRLVPFFPPVDTNNFRPNQTMRRRARSELGVPENAILIGTVGNINPQKGHEYLIRAGSIIHSQIRDLFIRILGVYTPTQARYDAKLHKQTQDLGLANKERLQFVDPGDRVAELLPAFDIFLLTSLPRSEGIPTVILEAMACGLPVVATDVGGVREIVENGVTGLVVPPLDPIAIANATLYLLQNPELLQRMGKKARKRAVEYYDIEACANTHVRAFEAALAHHRRKRYRASPGNN